MSQAWTGQMDKLADRGETRRVECVTRSSTDRVA